MECEGDKVYFVQGKRCPVCNMYCVPIEEKKVEVEVEVESHHKTINHQPSTSTKEDIIVRCFAKEIKPIPKM
jgi:Cu2+-exporting ATPase